MGWVLFFDGDCAFCSSSVRRVARLDKRGRVAFAPLQGKLAYEMDFSRYASTSGGTMVLLRESDGQIFFRSDAVIELTRALGGFWRIFTLARFIPKSLRDWIYRQIADHRYLFPGKNDACSLPTPELAKRLRE
jgi:predicted DCC family thiol-disulfide oxidoreductase YuxK